MIDSDIVCCKRCIYDSKTPGILFDGEGVCNYCRLIEQLEAEYKTGTPEGERKFLDIVEQIKKDGKRKKYDCVVGVSGGTDSSFMLNMAMELGLRPLAAHYDNTWNSAIATENIRKITQALNVDLFTYVVDNKESDDIFRAFFKASVPELDGCTDIALTEVLYRAANKYNIKYIFEGHSFRAEGVSPLGIMYIDGKYISTIHKKFGSRRMKTFPNMNLVSFMKWIAIKRIRKIRPFWYIKYSKEHAREILQKKFNWQYYGGHHLENRMTAFHHSYYFPKKVGIDQRNNSLSAAVRSGIITREKAMELYRQPPYIEPELVEYFKKRLELTSEEFDAIMNLPLKTYHDFKTYKKTFERMRPFFWIMYKMNFVPKSFYVKYTSKSEL
jgi:N-acetyl sugar amidotransferase